jgi:hypothetical protein
MPVGVRTRLRHYGGLARTAGRLGRLLRDFKFDSISSALNFRPSVTL